jgi:uncharacterized MAPEG superfamily protein
MSFEITLLVGSAVLALVYVTVQSFLYKAQVGNGPTIGARDDIPKPERLAGRADRALRNFLETYPVFVALVVAVELSGGSDMLTQWGAGLYLAFRIVYLPLYLAGVPWIRTFSWNIATLGLALMIAGVLL